MSSPTPSPRIPQRSDSFTDEEEIPKHVRSTHRHHDVLMSPPLSQKSQDCLQEPSSYPLSDTECQPSQPQQQQEQQQDIDLPQPRPTLTLQLQQPHGQQSPSLHPFDQTSPSTPKKTLNWVNALPSHFDATSPERHPRKRRRRTNREELDILEDAFARNQLPDAAVRQELGERLGMSVRAVQIWFQNRRQTLRKKSVCSNGGGTHHTGSEEDSSRSEGELHDSMYRRSSGESVLLSPSPLLSPLGGPRQFSKKASKSCSDLISVSPVLHPSADSTTFLRAETCSSLPTIVSPLPTPPRHEDPHLRSVSPCKPLSQPRESTDSDSTQSEPVIKAEAVELSLRQILSSAVSSGDEKVKQDVDQKETPAPVVPGIVDSKTADMHLSMLLQEAKKRSGQGLNPPMALWADTSNKPVLNPTFSGTSQSMTACLPVPSRSMSTPSIKFPGSSGGHGQFHHRSISKTSSGRKHRPESNHGSSSYYPHGPSLYPRTMSLMEQVINRQQQQHQHYQTPPHSSTNFRQSSLSNASKRQGMYNSNNITSGYRSPSTSSSTISTSMTNLSQWGRQLQQQVADRRALPLYRPSSRSGLGQTAVRARRLSIGKYLFDSETDEDATDDALSPPSRQARKRRVRASPAPSTSLTTLAGGDKESEDGDETDEEDFLAQSAHVKKRLTLTPTRGTFESPNSRHRLVAHHLSLQPGREGHYRNMDSRTKSLKTSLSTLSLAGSSPSAVRDFGGHSLDGPDGPTLERNRTWSGYGELGSGLPPTSTTFSSPRKTVVSHASADIKPSHSHPGSRISSPSPPARVPRDLNLDELECASVLAGLGWSC
ncbi:hypothetical protein EMPS_05846 [Entomortierella parvispora]|uniref:Homeobox domain-containing protein n=1 Tax=Entomortierella parvispora TaxID=205924 RepID=A0A9P3HBR1_9FUNG|nr:hypothetical protein EMPS_05846 [Entomortierella parvispora]